MSFNFKLDPSSLPKLSPRGDNYTEWRSAWAIALKYAGLWLIVSGKSPRPTDITEAMVWDENDNKALVMILSSVHTDLTMTVATADTSPRAWNVLAERFDRDTGHLAIHLFRALTNIRHKDGEDLRNHVDNFHQLWVKMDKKCQSSSQSVARAMRPIFESDDVKGSFFLTTLPDTMDHVVDNLGTRDITKFSQIEPKMLDIAEAHTINDTDSTAYYTSTYNRSKQQASKPTNSSSDDMLARNECSWCQKNNMTFVGHIYKNCKHLKDHKDKKASKSDSKSKGKANVVTIDSDNEQETPTSTSASAFTAQVALGRLDPVSPHPILLSNSVSPNLVSPTISATASSVTYSSLSHPQTCQSPWLFDTGASSHMSGFIEDFTNLSSQPGNITIAGGMKLPVEGKGTVHLRCLLPDGSTKLAELTNVLYSRQLYNTRLFSWIRVRHGHQLNAKGDHLTIQDKLGSYALWAKYMSGCMQIQLEAAWSRPPSPTCRSRRSARARAWERSWPRCP